VLPDFGIGRNGYPERRDAPQANKSYRISVDRDDSGFPNSGM
jgi:hypothetical protein